MLLQILLPIIDTISIIFFGDVMQHKEQLASSEAYEYSSYFEYTGPLIEAADFAVANMEFSLGGKPYSGYPNFSAPENLPEEAMRSGIDLFICANNHICDRGTKGLARTIGEYKKMNAEITGIYRDSTDEAENNPYITYIKGIKFAFINFTYGTNGIPFSQPYIVNLMKKENILKAIERAKKNNAQIIVALPHWGDEYRTAPSAYQREWNEFLLKNGVDAVIGSHPHVVQPTETLINEDNSRQTTIYSMGNYVSNMSLKNTELGAAFILKIAKTRFNQAFIADCETIPLWCSRPGGLNDKYTVIPVEEYLDKEKEFIGKWNYEKMSNTYKRLKTLFDNNEQRVSN